MSTPLPAPEAGAKLDHLIDEVTDSHRPVSILGKRNSAVLVSADDWRAIEETLYLHQVPGLVDSIQAARAEPNDQNTRFEDLKW